MLAAQLSLIQMCISVAATLIHHLGEKTKQKQTDTICIQWFKFKSEEPVLLVYLFLLSFFLYWVCLCCRTTTALESTFVVFVFGPHVVHYGELLALYLSQLT